ncbi:MAG: hypothetical protein COZ43_07110 [Sphingomonadales bacterium CG_4_10_14_3_um_filter_58_15]|nr:MAG: hypothetical protein COZ43_07110 [Sphingomonadales bacterium CG_4_10_14_3_um_filter_58_15]
MDGKWSYAAMDRPKVAQTEPQDADDVSPQDSGETDWVQELIAMTRPGVEIRFPLRALHERVIPFQYDDFG